MQRLKTIALAAAVLGCSAVAALDAAAQPAPQPEPKSGPESGPKSGTKSGPANIPDEIVERIVRLGLKNIERASCDGFNACAPTTPEELKYPPVTLDQARVAVVVGTRTALANWCGLDGDRRSVLPMRRELRKLPLNNRQRALLAVVHGIQHSIAAQQLKARGTCDKKTRGKLDSQLPKTPGGSQ